MIKCNFTNLYLIKKNENNEKNLINLMRFNLTN